MFGLRQDELKQIHKVLTSHAKIREAIIFGSRATSKHKKTSDIDIALKGELTIQEIGAIQSQLNEETTLPYFFDVINYRTINNAKLKQQIDTQGKQLYTNKGASSICEKD